jgi:predicted RNA-binding Zn-ribbon protein involved in translation (DUF1610 family)
VRLILLDILPSASAVDGTELALNMAFFFKQLADVESLCNGCRKECDQKCVIDNHEIEIIQSGLEFEIPNCGEHAFCPSGGSIAGDFCAPSQRSSYPQTLLSDRATPASYRLPTAGFASDRSHSFAGHGRHSGNIYGA